MFSMFNIYIGIAGVYTSPYAYHVFYTLSFYIGEIQIHTSIGAAFIGDGCINILGYQWPLFIFYGWGKGKWRKGIAIVLKTITKVEYRFESCLSLFEANRCWSSQKQKNEILLRFYFGPS